MRRGAVAVLLACGLVGLPVSTSGQVPVTAAPATVEKEPAYPRSTVVPEDMIRRRPRQVIALPSEPGEYGEDPLQLSSGVLGKLPPDVHRLPEGYYVASQQMAVEQQGDWLVCFMPDERLMKADLAEAGTWPGELDARGLPAGLVKACQDQGVNIAPESKVAVEEQGRRWRIGDPRRTLIVEHDRGGVVVRYALGLRLLPNKRLAMLESVLAAAEQVPNFAFTGRVTEFQGNNYLLVDHIAEVVEAPAEPHPAEEAIEDQPATQPADVPADAAGSGEIRPEDIIKQLLERKPRRALVLPQSMPAAGQYERPLAPEPGAERRSEQVLPEETMIVERPGRVVPVDQWWTFSFEDRGRRAGQRPLRILPNRMLENAIALAGDETMGVVLIVSGELTEYRGSNYLLLRKVLVRRDWGNLR